MKCLVLVAAFLLAAQAAPLSEQELLMENAVEDALLDQAMAEFELDTLTDTDSTLYSFRTMFEQWSNGDIGFRKSLQALYDLTRGKKNPSEIKETIKEVFGATSAVTKGFILMVSNFGVHVFLTAVNKMLGRGFQYTAQQVGRNVQK